VPDLLDRICVVTLTRLEQTKDERRFSKQTANRIEIRELRIQFAVKKTLGKSPNECKFTATNLNAATRAEVEGPVEHWVATLAAGHAGVARHLFTGDVMLAFSEKKGADWETEFTLKDGGRAFANARVTSPAGSYQTGTPVLRALQDLAKAMGMTLPESISNEPAFREKFAKGHVLRDQVRDELTQLLAAAGYSWSIQDGRLQIVSDTSTVGVERELSAATGMIGSPTFERVKGGKKKAAFTKANVNNILYPELTPGGTVRLQARSHSGRLRMEEVQHKGDTHGTGEDSWTTSVEAREVK
jgi:hypothetical protein